MKYTFVIFALLCFALPLPAQWGHAPDEYIELNGWIDPQACSDGNGGIWITSRMGDPCVGVEHIDRYGNVSWEGIVTPLPGCRSWGGKPVQADNGDLIVGFYEVLGEEDHCSTFQRISQDGKLLWGENGIRYGEGGVGGLYRGPVPGTYLYETWDLVLFNDEGEFHRILMDGEEFHDGRPVICNSNDSCVFVARQSDRDFWLTKILITGEYIWGEEPVRFEGNGKRCNLTGCTSDSIGGLIFTWVFEEYENANDSLRTFGVKACRIDSDGEFVWQRIVYERETDDRGAFYDIQPIINCADSMNFFIAWTDWPYAFKVAALNIEGEFIWDEPIEIAPDCTNYDNLYGIDSYRGVCYVWIDWEADREALIQQWGQRISTNGECLWGDRGRAIQARNITGWANVSDCDGGLISAISTNITVQMINRNGELGVVLNTAVEDSSSDRSMLHEPRIELFPNPFNDSISLNYSIPMAGKWHLSIFDINGRKVTDFGIKDLERGHYNASWQPNNLSQGIYFIRLSNSIELGNNEVVKKVLYLK